MHLEIDAEFRDLIPPLAPDELTQLEASLLAEGCRDALVVWQETGVLVDGHNRYALCQKHGIAYRTVERNFASREDVVIWICHNQMGRRNISRYARDELALAVKEAIARKGKQHMAQGLPHCGKPHNTRVDIATLASTSPSGISQSEIIRKEAPELIKEKARSGELSRRNAYDLTRALRDAPPALVTCITELGIVDLGTVEIMKRLYRNQSDTFTEICNSGVIQPGDEHEAVPITAPAAQVQAALDMKAKIYQQMAADEKKMARIEQARASAPPDDFVLGDCLDVLKTLPPQSVRLLLTDPPYGMDFQSNRRVASAKADKLAGDSDPDTALRLLADMLAAIDFAMQSECHLLIFTGWRHEHDFRQIITAAGYDIAASLVWVKENHTSGDLGGFAPRHERILHARRGRAIIQPRIDDVLIFPREYRSSHPTEKPVGLLKELIGCTTLPGEFVADPFAGSGSTVLAARALKRRVLGIEKDEQWWSDGLKEVHIAGKTG